MAKPKRTGLGLTICKEIIEHHHGRIQVTSELGRGTTFSIHLPSGTAAGIRRKSSKSTADSN